MFSVNMTFDKTLMMHFCYFFCKSRHFLNFELQMCEYSKLKLITFALFTLVHSQLTVTVIQQLNAKLKSIQVEF